MGQDPGSSVVDVDHRIHGCDNVYVADPSVFPTAPSVDPSLSIMAFSFVAADLIAARLWSSAATGPTMLRARDASRPPQPAERDRRRRASSVVGARPSSESTSGPVDEAPRSISPAVGLDHANKRQARLDVECRSGPQA
jgi:hypothetical protein